MNSYELDQPLDLRLKALNLSRNFAHDLPTSGGIGHGLTSMGFQHPAVNHHPCVMVGAQPVNIMVNNLVLASAYNGSNTTQTTVTTATSCANLLTGSHAAHLNRNRHYIHYTQQQQQHNANYQRPQPQAAHYSENGLGGGGASVNGHSDRQAQLMMLANNSVTTENLAHQQAQMQQQQVHQQHEPQQQVQQQQDLSNTMSLPRTDQATSNSYCKDVGKQRQLSPPLQQRIIQPNWPVRSLSMSGQMLNPSHLSLMVSPASTPPTSAPSYYSSSSNLHHQQHNHHQLPHITSGVLTPPTIPQQPTPPFPLKGGSCATSPPGSQRSSDSPQLIINTNNTTLNTVPNSSTVSTASNTTTTTTAYNNKTTDALNWNSISQSISQSYNDATNLSSSSPPTTYSSGASAASSNSAPIVRQQSLVGRYNCKPCGIVFSQPETLRAHQEGYCTKTNRRSQSSVSPSTIQQQTVQPSK